MLTTFSGRAVKCYVAAGRLASDREQFQLRSRSLPGDWHFIADAAGLTTELLSALNPRYVFFLHWSTKVPARITTGFECVNFHMTDLPFGRGGSPLQNLIVRGIRDTMLSATRMTEELDAGPIYAKTPLSLAGRAQEIYERAGELSWDMIETIIETEPTPQPQVGEVVVFTRRRPEQSRIPNDAGAAALYDHIRMLDAEGYPHAYVELGDMRFEFTHASLDGDVVGARTRITRKAALS